jgi:hypothetical protein
MTGMSGICSCNSETVRFDVIQQDTIPDNQFLYNGRIWKNFDYGAEGDQFLFSRVYMPGSLTIRGRTFEDVTILYDIYKDEILTPIFSEGILQLNKEMVDSFSILFKNKTYRFTRMPEDSLKVLKGYVNVIYKGKTSLYVKYNKKIERSAVEGKTDKFYQISRIYFVKDNIAHLITTTGDLFRVLNEYKRQIKDFIKKNQSEVSKKEPESYIPVIRYYDSISQ